MKKILYLLVLLAGFFASAQVKIGNNHTNVGASSALEIESTDKSLLIPRVASTAAITSPTNGLIIFDISQQCVRGYADGAWTDCGLRNIPTTPVCPAPSGLAVASTGGSSIATGGSTSFTLSGTNISSSSWSISPTTGVSVTSGTGSPTGNITFSTDGTYTITYVASSTGSCTTATANATASITVASTPPCPTPSGLSVASSAGSSINAGGSTNFSLSGANISSSSWSISPTTGVSITSGTGSPTGNITFATDGTYTITYVASSTGSCITTTANATASVTVTTPASPCPTPSSLAVASSAGSSINSGSATSFSLSGSNISSSSWSISPTTGVSVISGTGSPTGNITFSTAGTYTITYVASSTGSCTTTTANAQTSITVNTISISGLTCGSATFSPNNFQSSVAYTGSATVPYTGGNGASYPAGSAISSTGITGLTATLQAGTLASGSGNLTFTITGTPIGAGIASFAFTFGGQNCTIQISTCGVFVSAGVWKAFMCHNLGADTSLDPNVPVIGIHGNYYQWGRSTVVADASTSSAAIGGWDTSTASNTAWLDASKTANDPCPSGYRVPTFTQWTGIIANNTLSGTGPFTNVQTNFGAAIHWGPNASTKTLTLPTAGNRASTNGIGQNRGGSATYWSSTAFSGVNSYYLSGGNGYAVTTNTNRATGFPVRCIAE